MRPFKAKPYRRMLYYILASFLFLLTGITWLMEVGYPY